MNISAKRKSWIKRIGLVVTLGVISSVLIYNAILFRFRDIVQLALDIETRNTYDFDAGEIDIRFFRGKLLMRNAYLKFKDTTLAVTHHNVSIPEVQLEVESFIDLILYGKLYVKNLEVVRPSLATTAFASRKHKHMTMQASGIIENLKKIARHLNVEKFSLSNGDFSYRHGYESETLIGNQIMVNLIGFSDKNLKSNTLGGNSELEIIMGRQHWVLPDGTHEVFFRSLYFSAAKDILEVDSLRIVDQRGETSRFRFFTEKLRMKSAGLMPTTEENGMTMDSVLVVRPVLELGDLRSSGKKTPKINPDSVRNFLDQLVIRYLDIREGQIDVSRTGMEPISSQRSDIRVFNFKLRPQSQKKITTDSIDLSLHDIRFYSRDSMFRLNVGHCGFRGQHLNFSDVSYGPSEKNNDFHGLVFHAPDLQLQDIDADQLLNKKIHASAAIIVKPDVRFFWKNKRPQDSTTALRKEHHQRMMENLQNILNVPFIQMEDGHLSIHSPYGKNESLEAHHIYLTVMLNQLTKSENRQEMKSAITHFSSEKIEIQVPRFRLVANNFIFSGADQASNISRLHLQMNTGNSLAVRNMSWQKLDWDELLNNHKIDLSGIHLQQATLKMVKKPQVGPLPQKKKLYLNVDSASIGTLNLESETDGQGFISAQGKDISTQALNNESGHMTWNNLMGNFSNFHQRGINSQITADHIDIRREDIRVRNFQFRKANGNNSHQISIPSVMISAPFFNSAKNMQIAFIDADHPVLKMIKRDSVSADQERQFLVPEDIFISKVNLNEADISYSDYSSQDSAMVNMTTTLRMDDVSVTKGKIPALSFNSFSIQGIATDFSRPSLTMTIPVFSLQVMKGKFAATEKNKVEFTGAAQFSWKDASFKVDKPGKMQLHANEIAGHWANEKFHYQSGEKIDLNSVIKQVSFSGSNIEYANPKITAASAKISWNDRNNRSLRLSQFTALPTATWEEWVEASSWQADYLTLKGGSLDISGIDLNITKVDTLIGIEKISATGISLTTLKDKRKPFRHGIDKGMPTELVERIPFPVKVDTIQLVNSEVLVSQISEKTSKKATIPIKSLNAQITGISNQKKFETLSITASAAIYDNHIRSLTYREYYQEAAGFSFSTKISSMVLPSFNPISVPLANIAVKNGTADTLFASWEGNKLAAVGEMNFYYSKLKIAILNKKNPEKQTPIIWAENGIANLFIRNSNNGNSYMILSERDSEKFFFTYWVKSLFSGMLSTSGIRSEKKYRRTFKKNKEIWQLNFPEYLVPQPVNAMK